MICHFTKPNFFDLKNLMRLYTFFLKLGNFCYNSQ